VSPAPPYMTVDEYFRTPVTLKPMERIYGALRVAESPARGAPDLVIEVLSPRPRIGDRIDKSLPCSNLTWDEVFSED
jgi:hypothetical protein